MFPLDPIIKQKLIDFIDNNDEEKYTDLINKIIGMNCEDGVFNAIEKFFERQRLEIDRKCFIHYQDCYLAVCDKIQQIKEKINGIDFIHYIFYNIKMEIIEFNSVDLSNIVRAISQLDKFNFYHGENSSMCNLGNDLFIYSNIEYRNILIHKNNIDSLFSHQDER